MELTPKQQARLAKMYAHYKSLLQKGWNGAAAHHATLTSCRDKQVVQAYMASTTPSGNRLYDAEPLGKVTIPE